MLKYSKVMIILLGKKVSSENTVEPMCGFN